MNLSRTSAIVIRHFYLVSGSPARVLPLFAWVAIDMVLWGFITKYLNAVSSAGFDFVPVFLGAVLLWPLYAVLRRFRRGKGADPAETGGESVAAALPESPGAAKADKP